MRQPLTLASTLTTRHDASHLPARGSLGESAVLLPRTRYARSSALVFLGAFVMAACGGEESTQVAGESIAIEPALPGSGNAAAGDGVSTGSSPAQEAPTAPAAGSLYGIATQIFGADS